MASEHKNRRSRGKASSLDETVRSEVRPQPEKEGASTVGERDFVPTAKVSNSKRLTFWSDLTVILLVIFIAVVGLFGYRILKKSTVDNQTVTVAYDVCLWDVPSETDLAVLEGCTLQIVGQTEAWELGTVEQALREEGTDTVRLSVRAEAQYCVGQGYSVSSQRLLAGSATQSGVSFVVGDVSASGMIVSLAEA